jgi:hypothetical protein
MVINITNIPNVPPDKKFDNFSLSPKKFCQFGDSLIIQLLKPSAVLRF